MPREHRCPLCGQVLAMKGMKYVCNTHNCEFVDRRHGNSVLDESIERRGQRNLRNDPWLYADRKSLR